MIFRLSSKLATKLKVAPSKVLPLDRNPLVDWSAHLFTAERTQFVIVTNTPSLYSAVFYGRGISDHDQFIKGVLEALREVMQEDGYSRIYKRLIATASGSMYFSKALNRSVTGSMNDMIVHAKWWLAEGKFSPHETALKLNDIPFSSLDYQNPREVFRSLSIEKAERNGLAG